MRIVAYLLRICLLTLLAGTSVAQAKTLNLTYDLLQNGSAIATVKESFTQTGKQYTIQSVTKGQGVYALMGERSMKSQGSVTAKGLNPSYFESLQSRKANKALRSTFNWQTNNLDLEIKGEHESVPLQAGAQDLLSVMYQFAWRKPKVGNMPIWVTNGKKLSQQQYIVSDEKTPIKTEAGTFNVFKLTESDGEKTLYVSKKAPYCVVKIELQEDGKRTEQILRKLSTQ